MKQLLTLFLASSLLFAGCKSTTPLLFGLMLLLAIALTQNDIKKVLAYSTVSQLGLMFVALGLGAFAGGIFHMATHAFFKALLFLGAGSVIHALQGEQAPPRISRAVIFSVE